MSTLGTVERPLCLAVIGSGPSGFYAAEALLKAPNLTARVDVFDRLPTPFGMVRGGVAPDHQHIKGVTATYEKVASDPRVRFFGRGSSRRMPSSWPKPTPPPTPSRPCGTAGSSGFISSVAAVPCRQPSHQKKSRRLAKSSGRA
jgi:hypothetical protein